MVKFFLNLRAGEGPALACQMPIYRVYPVDDITAEERRDRHEPEGSASNSSGQASGPRSYLNLVPVQARESVGPIFGGEILRDHMRHVMGFLDTAQVLMLSRVSKWMLACAREDSLWQLFCKKDFGVIYPSDDCNFRQTYAKAWKELVLWHDGKPDYVEFLNNSGRSSEGGIWSKKGRHGNTVEIMCAW
jgi:hypothetical protein